MSTAPAPLTPAELDAARIAAVREQTEAIRENTAAMVASRSAAQEMAAALAAKPVGVSEAFVIDVLRLVLNKPAA